VVAGAAGEVVAAPSPSRGAARTRLIVVAVGSVVTWMMHRAGRGSRCSGGGTSGCREGSDGD
jgi:hypothetical protein